MPKFQTGTIRLAAIALLMSGLPAAAEPDDSPFFTAIAGAWSGKGEIIGGTMKGKRFSCSLDGKPLTSQKTGFTLQGSCRSGLFSKHVEAVFERGDQGFTGRFLDGAAGEGLDVTGGSVTPRQAVLDISREDIDGALITTLNGDDTLNITISLYGTSRLVPVIELSLERHLDSHTVGSIR
ncbi:hypothetical protein FJU08_13300 [Martelella alba]|uniref:Uncharacterized protein n=1 Tax=Martelella alba TaxID=2590451 RepID=A0A506U9M8_9HYPH|nr:hypothetical protein [Martelella alba]TPW29774.1 hypothetical protein FJU08_13300 [Martelella alba]